MPRLLSLHHHSRRCRCSCPATYAVLSSSQANTDYFGDQMKSAAMQRARHIAAGEGGAAGSGDEAEEDEEDDDDIADEQGTIEAAEAAGDAGEAEPAAKAETAAAAAADGEAGDGKPGQPGQPAAPAGAQEEQQQQQQEVKNGQQQGDGEGEQEGDEESDDDEDVGSEEAAAEGQEAAGGPEVTGEQAVAVVSLAVGFWLLRPAVCCVDCSLAGAAYVHAHAHERARMHFMPLSQFTCPFISCHVEAAVHGNCQATYCWRMPKYCPPVDSTASPSSVG